MVVVEATVVFGEGIHPVSDSSCLGKVKPMVKPHGFSSRTPGPRPRLPWAPHTALVLCLGMARTRMDTELAAMPTGRNGSDVRHVEFDRTLGARSTRASGGRSCMEGLFLFFPLLLLCLWFVVCHK